MGGGAWRGARANVARERQFYTNTENGEHRARVVAERADSAGGERPTVNVEQAHVDSLLSAATGGYWRRLPAALDKARTACVWSDSYVSN